VQSSHEESELEAMVEAAKKHGIYAVFALPAHTARLKELIRGTNIKLGAAVGFPSGSVTTATKLDEIAQFKKIGVDELDVVVNITWLRSGRHDMALSEMKAVHDAAEGIPLKLILEVTCLDEEQIRRGCEIGMETGVEFIKTGTGWMPNPTTLRHIHIIADAVKGRCKLKAAGGVRDLATLLAMYEAGVTRFGIGSRTAAAILSEAALEGSGIG
jgi:deoxyribose-phosphate aldolase